MKNNAEYMAVTANRFGPMVFGQDGVDYHVPRDEQSLESLCYTIIATSYIYE